MKETARIEGDTRLRVSLRATRRSPLSGRLHLDEVDRAGAITQFFNRNSQLLQDRDVQVGERRPVRLEWRILAQNRGFSNPWAAPDD
jgi:hypothetical protein